MSFCYVAINKQLEFTTYCEHNLSVDKNNKHKIGNNNINNDSRLCTTEILCERQLTQGTKFFKTTQHTSRHTDDSTNPIQTTLTIVKLKIGLVN